MLALRTNTAKPTACIVRCALGLHNGSFLVLTSNEIWHLATAACGALTGYAYSTTALQHHGAPNGAHSWYKADDGLWWLGKISARTTTEGEYLARCVDDPGPIKLTALSGSLHATSTGGVQGSWCLQLRRGRSVARGSQSNVDESRRADESS